MKTVQYIRKVKKSQQFRDFLGENPEAYLCSLFFTRDFLEKKDETNIDFYSPEKGNIIIFKLNEATGEVERAENKTAESLTQKNFVPGKLSQQIKQDIDGMKAIILKEMQKQKIENELQKILVSLTNSEEGKPVWNITGLLKGLGLLQARIEDRTGNVLSMEKRSFFDMLRFTGKGEGKKEK